MPRISWWAKRGSRSKLRLVHVGWLAALLLILAAGRLAAEPVTAAFTGAIADARSFQPLRLMVDLGGSERQVQLALTFPPGGRIVPALTAFTAGGRVHVQILNVYVPATAGAGAFTVRGTVTDGPRQWPFEAVIRVRANPKVVVRDEDVGFSIVRAEATVERTWRVTNSGNMLLALRATAMPSTGAVLSIDPANLTLAPGENREITLTARLESPTDRLVTMPLFLSVDSGEGALQRRETVGFTAEFIPRDAGPGPLFAELSGEVLAGGGVARDQRGMAGSFAADGEILTGVKFHAIGTDGTPAPGGSRLGLATRDFLTAELSGKTWDATGGLVNPPSFGFLESSTNGRGGTLAWSDDSGLKITALGAREVFSEFSREHAGLHAKQINSDQTGWEAGVLAQRNQSAPGPVQERLGGFAQDNWLWSGIAGSSQIAVAQDPASRAARLGLEQRLDYRTADERSSAAAFVQTAPAGFFLDGRSYELRDVSLAIATGETGRINLHASDSHVTGLLRSYRETETDAGLTPTNPQFVELITRDGSAMRAWSAGYGFAVNDGRLTLTGSTTDRTRETSELQSIDDLYRERTLTADWSRNFRNGQIFFTATAAMGTEANLQQLADFAEGAVTLGGALTDKLQVSTEFRHTWHTGGSPNTGYRQPGTYGRGSLTWTPHPRWRFEAGLDGYQFSGSPSRVRSYATLEVPVSLRVALATEISHDDERTSLWLAVRINFKTPMPWRPVRGALSGRVSDGAAGTPVPGVRLDLDGAAGLSDAEGKFTLPGRPPGSYPFKWTLPAEYLPKPGWPHTVNIRAGELQAVDLVVQHIALLTGTVAITGNTETERPTGPVSATDEHGMTSEAIAAAGDFRLYLPPGHYVVRYNGETSTAVAAQLVATVVIGEGGEPAAVHLLATEKARGMRQTLFIDGADAPKPPLLP